ncbi:hypothetical protein GCM10009546_07070 [Actinomadura livida]|uniref:Uncharacterized protein n=1 Tax=Actinomadura livida TaxID=79909 RepID=A0A7W7I8A1_9ACTN|nr:hypothetical protein [Actinomadura catellatispora]MBB4772346.1 hypothetical protein [Actinomadura catellatispora]GGU23620.1 hypothetical protein GCM10010208_55900 [Actinomadura livida]
MGSTLPEKAGQARFRKKFGSRGGRRPKSGKVDYKERHAVERGINRPRGHPEMTISPSVAR